MNLTNKIEEIRKKPEHERVRYVWMMVSISMVFIVFIWFFSFKSMFRGEEKTNSGSDTAIEVEKGTVETKSPSGNKMGEETQSSQEKVTL